jgi:hypothetical protein
MYSVAVAPMAVRPLLLRYHRLPLRRQAARVLRETVEPFAFSRVRIDENRHLRGRLQSLLRRIKGVTAVEDRRTDHCAQVGALTLWSIAVGGH